MERLVPGEVEFILEARFAGQEVSDASGCERRERNVRRKGIPGRIRRPKQRPMHAYRPGRIAHDVEVAAKAAHEGVSLDAE